MQSERTRAPRTGPQVRKCKVCGDWEVSTTLINGECPECVESSGQLAIPLRGAGGRFLPGLTPNARQAARRGAVSARKRGGRR
jgi:hypothetical protein